MSEETTETRSLAAIWLLVALLALLFAAQVAAPCAWFRVKVAVTTKGFGWTTTACAPWADGVCVCQAETPEWVMMREGAQPQSMPPSQPTVKPEVVF